MIVLGIILLLIGYFTGLSILVVIGIVLWILGAVGRPVGGRKVGSSDGREHATTRMPPTATPRCANASSRTSRA
jgi:hypothetical protein